MLLTVLQRTIDDFITFKDFFLHFTLVLKFFENWTSTLFIRIKSSEPNLCFSLLLIALWFKCPFSAICGDWISILYIWPTLSPRLLLSPYFVKTTATFWLKKPQRNVEWLTSSTCGQTTMTLGSINGNKALLKEENQQISHKTCKLFFFLLFPIFSQPQWIALTWNFIVLLKC